MGILDRLEHPGAQAVTWTPLDDRWYRPRDGTEETYAGFPIGPDTALRVSAVFACASLIAETLASLPCQLLRRLDDGGKEKAKDHRLYRTLRHQPNSWMTPVDFFGTGQMHCGMRGRALAEIRDTGDQIDLVPLHPDFVKIEQLPTGRLRYEVRDPKGGAPRPLTQDRVLHVRDLTLDGVTGQSRAALAREAIAVAGAAEGYVGRFFKYDATGRLVITHPTVLDEKKRAEWRQTMAENQEGWANRSRTMHLHSGVTATELGKHDDSGFIIDPRRFQVADIARFWRVPLFMIGLEEKSTTWGTGIEQQKQGFVDFTIKPWADRWAQAMTLALLEEDEQDELVIEFLFDDLVRGDLMSRAQAFQIFRQIGVLNPNEIRAFQNWGTRPGGDTYQETPTGAAPNATRPASNGSPAPIEEEAAEVEEAQAELVLTPLLADAAARLATMETRAIARRAPKAAADPARWQAWVEEYYSAHRERVVQLLTPLIAAAGLEAWVAEEAASRIVRTALTAIGSRTGVPADWLEHRAQDLAGLLEETFIAGAAARRVA